jgi:hypothetical protein
MNAVNRKTRLLGADLKCDHRRDVLIEKQA